MSYEHMTYVIFILCFASPILGLTTAHSADDIKQLKEWVAVLPALDTTKTLGT